MKLIIKFAKHVFEVNMTSMKGKRDVFCYSGPASFVFDVDIRNILFYELIKTSFLSWMRYLGRVKPGCSSQHFLM